MFQWTAILSYLLSSDLVKDSVSSPLCDDLRQSHKDIEHYHTPYDTYIVYTKSCYGGTGTDNYIHNIYIINTLLELYSRYIYINIMNIMNVLCTTSTLS